MMQNSYMADRWKTFGTSIFTAISEKAREHKAVNLAQGFPDFAGPQKLLDAVATQVQTCHNQYSHATGEERLRVQLSYWLARSLGRTINPQTEITITTGATEALYSCINAFLNPGDRVVVFEPFYDSYAQAIANAGGVLTPIRLHAPDTQLGLKNGGDWAIDWDSFNAVAKGGFKLLILNTPHNPTGKVFSHEELGRIAKAVEENDAVAICDEVYEHLVYDNVEHVSLLTLPRMDKHVVRISSAAKTFGFTGFKVGWVVANERLSQAVRLVHQAIVFCTNAHVQLGLADVMSDEQWLTEYLRELNAVYLKKRNFLVSTLKDSGFEPARCPGTYFVMASFEKIEPTLSDVEFATKLIQLKAIAAIPPSAFYLSAPKHLPWLRFAFCKKDETLLEAKKRFQIETKRTHESTK